MNNNFLNLLKKFKTDKSVIKELSKYNLDTIMNVIIEEKLYDLIPELSKPIEIDGELQIFFDLFSYINEKHGYLSADNFVENLDLSKEEKEKLVEDIYSIDFNKIYKTKVCNTLPRKVSGISNKINGIKDIIFLSEPACFETIKYLYECNIRTLGNNTECIRGEDKDTGICEVDINIDGLDENNKKIVEELILTKQAMLISSNCIAIYTPCSKYETIGEINNRLLDIAKSLKKQKDFLYNNKTREEAINIILEKTENDEYVEEHDKTLLEEVADFIYKGLISENPDGEIKTNVGKSYSLREFAEKYFDIYEKTIGTSSILRNTNDINNNKTL